MSVNQKEYTWPKIVLFGDSITQYSFKPQGGCWGALLADHLQRKCDVLNRGFSGFNSRWCKFMLPKIVTADITKDLAGVTLFLGANDSNNDDNIRQHVPLNEFTTNMTEMIEYLQSIGIEREKIILITCPAYDNDAWVSVCLRLACYKVKYSETTRKYASSCNKIAKETGVSLVDLYNDMLKHENWKEMLGDGLHLSAAGGQLLFESLKPIIDKLTSNIETKFPAWDEVDIQNPQLSL
ncbi:hypothetical protein LOTGIDRAFT_111055 [Lottia gigantea]|uniref:Isoamyl acetate-hydrolyzing esterase 1 homolog n=1 Tax=Lottia gigantea TaxID=225164 RepID=V4BAM8_LOTGI|nr:hypothetical protein LOTGIDRAFT_111055 [Lottia gigantea]ESP02992.1 hypothetical protein LOTGIDRAFT_111055 [Lottia gigantea]